MKVQELAQTVAKDCLGQKLTATLYGYDYDSLDTKLSFIARCFKGPTLTFFFNSLDAEVGDVIMSEDSVPYKSFYYTNVPIETLHDMYLSLNKKHNKPFDWFRLPPPQR